VGGRLASRRFTFLNHSCDFFVASSLDPSVTRSPDDDVLVTRLFEQHGSAIRRYLRRLTREPDVARDLTQEVYVRVVRGADRYEPRERERAWLFRIARNVFLDYRKRLARDPQPPSPPTPRVIAAVAAPQALRVDLEAALRQLDEIDREAFLLCELDGLRYDEIAGTLGLTVGSVRSRIYRARLALRAMLMPPAPVASTPYARSDDDDH
jgi:RNA polymerase sigma-70 factor (ECF subfamily)